MLKSALSALLFVFLCPFLSAKTIKGDISWLSTGNPGFLKIEGVCKECFMGDLAENGTGIIKCQLDKFDTGISLRNKHMKEKYLETKKYPEASLKIEKAANGSFSGILTIKEDASEVEGKYELKGESVDASFKVDLSKFKSIGVPGYLGVSMAKEVDVRISALLH